MCPSSNITENVFERSWSIPTGMLVRNLFHLKSKLSATDWHTLWGKPRADPFFYIGRYFVTSLSKLGFLYWLTVIITFAAFIKHIATQYPPHKAIWRLLSKDFFFFKLYRWFQSSPQTESHWSNYISSQLPKILSLITASFGLSNCFLLSSFKSILKIFSKT